MEKIIMVEDGKVSFLRDELQIIPEFATLFTYKYNKQPGDLDGKKRVRATQELAYMWYMYSHNSPYKEYSEEERKVEALLIAELPPDFKPSKELSDAIARYRSLNETRMLKLIKSAEKAIDSLRNYFETVDFAEKNANGVMVNKPSEVIRAILDLDKVAVGLEKLAQRQLNELKEGAANRGGQEEGWIMENDNESRQLKQRHTADDSGEEESEL
jgi:hypothetical protein